MRFDESRKELKLIGKTREEGESHTVAQHQRSIDLANFPLAGATVP